MRTDPEVRHAESPGDAGVTMVELVVTMVLFAIIGGAALTALLSVVRSSAAAQERSTGLAQAQLALNQVARQVRSGNVLNDPAAGTSAWSLLIYTQANGTNHCVQWRAYFAPDGGHDAGELTSTAWVPGSPSSSTTTQVASGLLVSGTASPFALDPAPAYGSRLLKLSLRVPMADGDAGEVSTSVAARNTQYDYPIGIC